MTSNTSFWTRRQFISTSAWASMAVGCNATNAADSPSLTISKSIPGTGERLPAIGIGTSFFATLSYGEVLELVRKMYQLGGTVIDTAAYYGSEPWLGRAIEELGIRDKVFISTKFNSASQNFGANDTIFGEESFLRSLSDLRTSYVDLLEVHKPHATDELMPLMLQYKQAGKIRYLGTTTWLQQEHDLLAELMRKYPLDFIQVDYSIGNRDAEKVIFPLAQAKNIAVMVNVPLGGVGGSLFNAVKNRPLPSWAAEFDATSWSQFLLKYVISHPAVTCVIPGATKLDHLEDNQRAGLGRLPSVAMRQQMEDFWASIT